MWPWIHVQFPIYILRYNVTYFPYLHREPLFKRYYVTYLQGTMWHSPYLKDTMRHMSHIWMSHVSYMNESCLIYEWVMSHIWMSHSPYLKDTICHMFPIYILRYNVTYLHREPLFARNNVTQSLFERCNETYYACLHREPLFARYNVT